MWTLFNYLYRDAGNYKLRHSVALAGYVTELQKLAVKSRLQSGEFFIAEQVGVPALQIRLQSGFGGRNNDNHCWHSLESWERCDILPINIHPHAAADAFIERFLAVEHWREELSPDFC